MTLTKSIILYYYKKVFLGCSASCEDVITQSALYEGWFQSLALICSIWGIYFIARMTKNGFDLIFKEFDFSPLVGENDCG